MTRHLKPEDIVKNLLAFEECWVLDISLTANYIDVKFSIASGSPFEYNDPQNTDPNEPFCPYDDVSIRFIRPRLIQIEIDLSIPSDDALLEVEDIEFCQKDNFKVTVFTGHGNISFRFDSAIIISENKDAKSELSWH